MHEGLEEKQLGTEGETDAPRRLLVRGRRLRRTPGPRDQLGPAQRLRARTGPSAQHGEPSPRRRGPRQPAAGAGPVSADKNRTRTEPAPLGIFTCSQPLSSFTPASPTVSAATIFKASPLGYCPFSPATGVSVGEKNCEGRGTHETDATARRLRLASPRSAEPPLGLGDSGRTSQNSSWARRTFPFTDICPVTSSTGVWREDTDSTN